VILLARRVGDAVEIQHGDEVLLVEPWGPDAARVRAGRHRIRPDLPGALDERPAAPDATIEIGDDRAELRNGRLIVRVAIECETRAPAVVLSFLRAADGAVLLSEQRIHFNSDGTRAFSGNRAGSYAIDQQFFAYEGERLYGMGQRSHGSLDLKGMSLDLHHRNGEVSIPFVISSRGYGLLWNMPGLGRVDFGRNATRWHADMAVQVDYWVVAGPGPRGILARYADVTGHAPQMPDWASGFWQSKLRYRTQEELLDVAREYRRLGLPLSVIACDYFHWTAMGDFRFDVQEWPDPAAMVAELREMGVELMVSVWPTVSPLSENYDTFDQRGLLLRTDQGLPAHRMLSDKGAARSIPVSFYDPTNPEARRFVWSRVAENYLAYGIRCAGRP
jgi:alpha-D-xyloside xylohydrolase